MHSTQGLKALRTVLYSPHLFITFHTIADFFADVKWGETISSLFSYLDGVTWPTTRVVKKTPGRKQPNLIYQYRFARQLPIRDGNDALRVNYVELQIRRVSDRKPTQSFRFITSLDVTQANAAEIAAAGRARWKIGNEGFNLLKKHGYHMEHNFGHGKQGLSDTLMTLSMDTPSMSTKTFFLLSSHI